MKEKARQAQFFHRARAPSGLLGIEIAGEEPTPPAEDARGGRRSEGEDAAGAAAFEARSERGRRQKEELVAA